MNKEKLYELAELVKIYGLTRLEYRDDNAMQSIVMEKQNNPRALPAPATAVSYDETHATFMDAEEGADTLSSASMRDTTPVTNPHDPLVDITAPIVGVFYGAPSPDSPPFVSIGTPVKRGDVLCIIEAMKLMNEIIAEQDGEIADICIKNGEIAEFGQVLFKLKV